VSKFTKTSLFSELNNLRDITLARAYANICGFTHEDVSTLFGERLAAMRGTEEFAGWPEVGENSLLAQIYAWYDGYSWDGKTRVFNPFSLLNFFANQSFSPYWFASGSPSFLIELIKRHPASYQNMDGAVIDEAALEAADIHHISTHSLMFQTGYLTVQAVAQPRSDQPVRYPLTTPNLEVRMAFCRHIVIGLTGAGIDESQSAQQAMTGALESGAPDQLAGILARLFASIPYEIHIDQEAYYQSIFYALLRWLGFRIEAEVSVARGRVDGVLELSDKVYVLEFKYKKHKGAVVPESLFAAALEEGMAQIDAQGYCDRYRGGDKAVYKVAVAVAGRGAVRVRYEYKER
jgi:hypothetical protein